MMLLSRAVVTVVILASACDVSFSYSKKRVLGKEFHFFYFCSLSKDVVIKSHFIDNR